MPTIVLMLMSVQNTFLLDDERVFRVYFTKTSALRKPPTEFKFFIFKSLIVAVIYSSIQMV